MDNVKWSLYIIFELYKLHHHVRQTYQLLQMRRRRTLRPQLHPMYHIYNIQLTTLATTVDNQDISQEIAPKLKQKTTKTTITDLNVKPKNATIVVVLDTSPKTAAQVHP